MTVMSQHHETGMEAADAFEAHRRFLRSLAYRMLGSLAEAEDAVQDCYLRWHQADRGAVTNVRAFLAKTVTRLCIDRLKSARARRETYVGPWLPEPVLEADALAADTASEYAEDLSMGLMLALERLSPLERAAFLLHDIFDVDFAEVGKLIGRNETACRQLAARARAHVRDARPRFPVAAEAGAGIAAAFATALLSGDVSALAGLLAKDATLHSDGGGIKKAALNILVGRDEVAKFFGGVMRKFPEPIGEMQFRPINGMPGLLMRFEDGSLQTIALEIADGEIAAVYVVRNPEKLSHLAAQMH
jgi:RNA polymerase sigma-70 factor (ECF subfamily)